jgi:hypothetical protein
VNGKFYIQNIGIPMGAVLSPCLANIYLGVMEKFIESVPEILFYTRYVDDVLLLSNFTESQMEEFINKLQSSFHLTLTASANSLSVNFLDMKISYSYFYGKFFISPFSKNYILFPLPSTLFKRPFRQDVNIIKSQILRVWRNCTDDLSFSRNISIFLNILMGNSYFRKIRRQIITFLSPICIGDHVWTTSIPICRECKKIMKMKNIEIDKFILLDSRIISTKEPLKCTSPNIFVIAENHDSTFNLFLIRSIHEHIKCKMVKKSRFLPLGRLNEAKLIDILEKNTNLFYTHRKFLLKRKVPLSAYIHRVIKNPNKVYGVKCGLRSGPSFGKFFNKYRRIFQTCQ